MRFDDNETAMRMAVKMSCQVESSPLPERYAHPNPRLSPRLAPILWSIETEA
jgi:hypothetical protein